MVTDELNKKRAEWAGFEVLGIVPEGTPKGSLWGEVDMTGFWKHPSEERVRKEIDFPNSLDACFKWLVPKAIAFLATQPIGCPSIIQIYRWLFERWIEELKDESKPALALCLAIEKLIDEERKAIQ